MASDLGLRERMSDVLLKVRHEGFTWRMPAHSLLLVNKSQVFQEMMDERAGEEKPVHLTLVGMRPETAVAVLNYIYDNKYPDNVNVDLLIASQRFRLEDLHQNIEERLLTDMSVEQACDVLEELHQRQPMEPECAIKCACRNLLELHALTLFGSDLVFRLGKMALTDLLLSDRLNVPDEAYIFWGVWRWGRMQSSKHDRSLKDEDVQAYIDDLIVLLRKCSLKCRDGIPSVAAARFDRCKGRRTLYTCPPDILKHSVSLRPCPYFEDIIPPKPTEDGPVCMQISVEKDVMLVGLSLELSSTERSKAFVRVIRETDFAELRRTQICWCDISLRKSRSKGDPEHWLEAEVAFQQPVFLTPGNIYSIQLTGDFSKFLFAWGSLRKRRVKVGSTYVNFHGEGVTALRDIYLIPEMSVTWGPRGPSV